MPISQTSRQAGLPSTRLNLTYQRDNHVSVTILTVITLKLLFLQSTYVSAFISKVFSMFTIQSSAFFDSVFLEPTLFSQLQQLLRAITNRAYCRGQCILLNRVNIYCFGHCICTFCFFLLDVYTLDGLQSEPALLRAEVWEAHCASLQFLLITTMGVGLHLPPARP